MNLVDLILVNLINNEDYSRKVMPFLKPEYFESNDQKILFSKIVDFTVKYNANPTKETLIVELDSDSKVNDTEYSNIGKFLDQDLTVKDEWLVDKTEKWCQERSIYLAIMDSIGILYGNDKNRDKGSIPQLLTDALSVSFDNSIGHDFIEDAESRYDFYHEKQELLPFDLEYFNKITGGGLPKKTINVILAGTGVGKTLAMCHFAAANLMQGKNVLYVTLEMAEERISERIDENLLNLTKEDLNAISKDMYLKKMQKVGNKTVGKLIVKEYPTASVGAAHFRHLMNELRIKKNFVPDIVYVDYINLCLSTRLKSAENSYVYIKAIAEELRGLAV